MGRYVTIFKTLAIKIELKLIFDRFVVFRYMPTGPIGNKLSLSIDELKEVSESLVALEKDHDDTVISYEPLCFFPHLIDKNMVPLGPCNAGSDVLNFCVNGSVTPCPHMRNYILGRYPQDSLKEIWAKSAMFGKEIMSTCP